MNPRISHQKPVSHPRKPWLKTLLGPALTAAQVRFLLLFCTSQRLRCGFFIQVSITRLKSNETLLQDSFDCFKVKAWNPTTRMLTEGDITWSLFSISTAEELHLNQWVKVKRGMSGGECKCIAWIWLEEVRFLDCFFLGCQVSQFPTSSQIGRPAMRPFPFCKCKKVALSFRLKLPPSANFAGGCPDSAVPASPYLKLNWSGIFGSMIFF